MIIRVLIICNIADNAASRADIDLVYGLHKRGIQVDVMICPNSVYVRKFTQAGIRVIPSYPIKKISLATIRLIRKEIKQRNYQIIHLFNSKAIVNGSLAAIGLPVKVIAYRGAAGIYWHDPTAWCAHLNPRIDSIICVSHYVKNHMQRQLLFRPQKAVTIYKGIDFSWFKEIVPAAKATLDVPRDAVIIGCVANVRRVKGIPYLLKAAQYLKPDLNIHILLIGRNMDSHENMRIIQSLPFKDRIHIMGYRDDVYTIIAACDIYIQPSLKEGLSRSVMEAMCLGIPCIVSDAGGLIELVEHEKSGLIVRKADPESLAKAIERLAINPAIRKSFASEAFYRMKDTFSTEDMVINTINLYERLLLAPKQ